VAAKARTLHQLWAVCGHLSGKRGTDGGRFRLS
jgi:hypothetical protein